MTLAFINEQTSSLADLVSKLNTHLTGEGWTSEAHVPASGEWAMRKTGSGYELRFAAQWDTSSPDYLGLYHYVGQNYNVGGGTVPYDQDNDSGNGGAGTTNAVLDDARNVRITNTPVQYWCFSDDTYFHCVVEVSSGFYRHFGVGQITKHGDWTGGEYCYGHKHDPTPLGSEGGIQEGSNTLLDGLASEGPNEELFSATVHLESFPGQTAGGKWGVCIDSTTTGNDRQGTPVAREIIIWGFRAGPYGQALTAFTGSDLSGHVPAAPIVIAHEDNGNSIVRILGYMQDVRQCSIQNYSGGQEITFGAETWMIFPTYQKWSGSGSQSGTSAYQGIIYRKS